MPTKIITPATFLPLTLDEAKAHLRVALTRTDEDDYITSLCKGAAEQVEADSGIVLARRTVELYLDAFPSTDRILLPWWPVASIESVKYYDTDGVLQTFDSTKYALDAVTRPARLYTAYTEVWPGTREIPNAVIIQHKIGYERAGAIKTFTISAAGTGYSVADELTVEQSTESFDGRLTVDTIDGGGGVTAATLASAGYGYEAGTGIATTVLPAGGSGCEIDITAIEDELPGRFKVAMRWLVSHWFENREPVTESRMQELPQGYLNLLWSLKV